MPANIFHAQVLPSLRTFDLQPGETVLQAGLRCGVNLPYGCQDGACGSCKCLLSAGQVQMQGYQDKALSAQERDAGQVLTCRAYACSDLVLECPQVNAEGVIPARMMPSRVRSLQRLAPDVMRLDLQMPANEAYEFRAGQYLTFLLPGGLRRSYSMACSPKRAAQNGLELHIRHMPGGVFTDQVFDRLQERAILRLEGPHGSFYLRENSDLPMIWVASGTGFAPLKAMLEHALDIGLERPTTLYWGGRRPQDLYLHDWLLQQLPAAPWLRYVPVVSDARPEDGWRGREGFVHRAVLQDQPTLSSFAVYACGAPIVVESARRDFVAAGLAPENFYADAFTSAADAA